jgi:hypothetical protein
VEERRDNKVPSKMDNPLFGGATMLTANRIGANDIPSLYTATVKSTKIAHFNPNALYLWRYELSK